MSLSPPTFQPSPQAAPHAVPPPHAVPALPVRRRVRLMIALLVLLVLIGVNLAIAVGKLTIEKVISGSMEPTLLIGDKLLVDANALPERYSIIVVDDPTEPDGKLVKRLIGLPGDEIRIRNTRLYVNGEPDRSERISEGSINWDDLRIVVPADHIYLLGDNRNNSFDSLNFGPVPFESVHGVVTAIIWPPARWHKPLPY